MPIHPSFWDQWVVTEASLVSTPPILSVGGARQKQGIHCTFGSSPFLPWSRAWGCPRHSLPMWDLKYDCMEIRSCWSRTCRTSAYKFCVSKRLTPFTPPFSPPLAHLLELPTFFKGSSTVKLQCAGLILTTSQLI